MITRLFLNAFTISESSVCNARPRILLWIGAWEVSHFSCVWLLATLWTVVRQALLSMGFSRQEYWSGLPFPSAGKLPNPGIEPTSLMSPALAIRFLTTSATWEELSGFPGSWVVKNPPANTGDAGLIPGSGRSPGEGICNPSNILAWEIPRSQTQLSGWTTVTWDSWEHWFIPETPFRRSPEASSPAAAAKSLQSCLTLCDPIDGSPPGSPIPGILQARTLEWVAISFSKAWKWKMKVKSLSHVWLLATPWTAAHQAPSSMGFSRQKHWSGGATAFSWHRYKAEIFFHKQVLKIKKEGILYKSWEGTP